jgi:1,2-diacylglycerol 3-alpha-glucosyltransferase
MRDRLLELGVEVPIEVVPSGIDLDHFRGGRRDARVRARFGVRESDRLLVTVSRLAKEKNIDLLLHALALASRDVRLVIAGEGPYEADLRALAIELGVADRVVFAGAIARDALPDLYAGAEAFVFGSITETQGLVLVEALAAGARVIATDVPQIRQVTGEAALLVPPLARAFARAFDALEGPPSAPEIECARAAAAPFDQRAQARRMEALYDQLTRTYVRYTIVP